MVVVDVVLHYVLTRSHLTNDPHHLFLREQYSFTHPLLVDGHLATFLLPFCRHLSQLVRFSFVFVLLLWWWYM